MALTRRNLVKVGLGGALLLAVDGVGVGLQRRAQRTPASPLRVLDPRAFSVLAAVADRVAPARAGFPAASELHVAEKVDALLATMHPADGEDLRQALLLLENAFAGLVLDGRPTPFTRLDPAAQDRVLRAWQTSRLHLRRTAFEAMRGLCAAAYYASPEIHRLVGYPGPPDFGNVPRADRRTP